MSACAIALLGAMAIVLTFGRETAGRTLEEITATDAGTSAVSIP